MRRIWFSVLWVLLPLISMESGVVKAANTDYEPVSVTPQRQVYFSLVFDKNGFTVLLPSELDRPSLNVSRGDLMIAPGNVSISGKPIFDQTGLHVGDTTLPLEPITDLQIEKTLGQVMIRFMTAATSADPVAQKRRGNRTSNSEAITIAAGEFVRGVVFSVTGDIRIDGEVNKDVVSLFGSVQIGQAAVIRGDVASVTGNIEVERQASVYGDSYSGASDKLFHRPRLNRGETETEFTPILRYNRVDGANPNLEVRITDADSALPTIWGTVGYAFASTSWRLQGGIEQTLNKKYGLTVGVQGHRALLSDDDWLISDAENSVYAILVTEDFKDYYEGIGGSAYFRVRPVLNLTAEAGYRSDITNWLPANRNLWSLFGGEKRFSENFTTLPNELLSESSAAIDTGRIASLYASITYDNRRSDPFSGSAWAMTLTGESSDPELSSDYNFSRYAASLRRYQKVSPLSMLLIRGMIGGSTGEMPAHRTFYLGGLGTLSGYRHKELLGSRFWMMNWEFRQTLPKTDLAISALWDVAQIGYREPADRSIEVRHSLGGAVYFGDDVRVSVARRLDGYSDKTPRFFVRIEHHF